MPDGDRSLWVHRRAPDLDPWREHDACGVGFVARASGEQSHDILTRALQAVARVAHRGAASTDNSGDGAGLLTQIPRRLLAEEAARLGLPLGAGQRFAEAVRRANAYRAAGADCLFVPHVGDAETIGRLAREIAGPLNVIAGPGAPSIPELERLGVRRASLGPRLIQGTLGLLARAARELRERGTYATLADLVVPFAELQRLLGPTP